MKNILFTLIAFVLIFTSCSNAENNYSYYLEQTETETETENNNAALTYQTAAQFRITGSFPAHRAINVSLETEIEIRLLSEAHESLSNYFTITPNTAGSFTTRGNSLVFIPENPLQYETLYTVTIQENQGDFVFQFETAPLPDSRERVDRTWRRSFATFNAFYMEFPTSVNPVIEFFRYLSWEDPDPTTYINVYRFHDNESAISVINNKMNIPRWAYFSWQQTHVDLSSGFTNIARLTYQPSGLHFMDTYMELPVFTLGFYVATITTGEFTDQMIFQVTDVAVQVLSDDTQIFLWINNMETGYPLHNTLAICQNSGQIFTSDTDGIVRINRGVTNKPEIFHIQDNNTESYLIFMGNYGGTARQGSDFYWSVLQTDRNLFQDSDTLHFWGLIQNRDTDEEISNITAVITRDSWWNVITGASINRVQVPVSNGIFSGEMDFVNLHPGSYRIRILHDNMEIDSAVFTVRQFDVIDGTPMHLPTLPYSYRRRFTANVSSIQHFINHSQENSPHVLQGTSGRSLFVTASRGILYAGVPENNRLNLTFDNKHVPNVTVYEFNFTNHIHNPFLTRRIIPSFLFQDRIINIDISLNSENFSPGESVTVTVQTTDLNGIPKASHVNISVVNEALFALQDMHTNTHMSLYSPVGSGIRTQYQTHAFFDRNRIFRLPEQANLRSAAVIPRMPISVSESEPPSGSGTVSNVRGVFRDTAYFTSFSTNADGFAKFTFTLPGDITSWRLTASAVSNNLYAGNAFENIVVTTPIHINYRFNNVFLVGDIPQIAVSVSEAELTGEEKLIFEVWCELNPERKASATGFMHERVNIPLWELTETGEQSIVINVRTESGLSDAVRHNFNVIYSHTVLDIAVIYDSVSPLTEFSTGAQNFTNITFTDASKSQLLHHLLDMRKAHNNRIDLLLLQRESNILLNRYFPDVALQMPSDSFNLLHYQRFDGGITNVPQSSSSLLTTVMFMPFILDEINESELHDFLFQEAFGSNVRHPLRALYGLAMLNSPVLDNLHQFKLRSDLTVAETAYLALAFHAIGEHEIAKDIYENRVLRHIQVIGPYLRINEGDNREQIIQNTAVVARLALRLDTPESIGLNHYVINQSRGELIANATKLNFVISQLNSFSDEEASITFALFGESVTHDLSKGQAFTLKIPTSDIHEFNITNVTGDVSAVSVTHVPRHTIEDNTDTAYSDIILTRRFINAETGEESETFNYDDLIRVEFILSRSRHSYRMDLIINDFLPSGLIFTQIGENQYDPNWVWADVEGQKVTIRVQSWMRVGYAEYHFHYYTRVINAGTFKAESTIVLRWNGYDYAAIGADSVVTIRG